MFLKVKYVAFLKNQLNQLDFCASKIAIRIHKLNFYNIV